MKNIVRFCHLVNIHCKVNPLCIVVAAMVAFLASSSSFAASMSASLTAPVVDSKDIANYGTASNLDKWFTDNAKGQTISVGDTGVMLNSVTYLVATTQKAEPTKNYTIRVGTVNIGAETFAEVHSETAIQNFTWNSSEYMTWTFDTPVYLAPNSEYGVDVGMTSSSSGWQTGIPYLQCSDNLYPGGARYSSGASGIGDTDISVSTGDRIFHLDMDDPLYPDPYDGKTISGGSVVLNWSNLPANIGSDVWVDVWFGTDPSSDFSKVVTNDQNRTTVTVTAPVADTYYWRVDSYLEGSVIGDPVESTIFTFIVDDTDGDGMSDVFELANTTPSSNTSLVPGADLEPDGLTNLEEFQNGTFPTNPDSDGDTVTDGDEVNGVGLRPQTDPTDPDSDDDGLSDGVESNTGTWVSAGDTGTNPIAMDSDLDGLQDGVESNTGVYVSESDTGTDPLDTNSDGDNATDWFEVYGCYTDPLDPNDKPDLPHPLPAVDNSAAATDKPVKVFIMSGQSNMVGNGMREGSSLGTLNTMVRTEGKFPNLVDGSGNWIVNDNVMYRGVISCIGDAPLAPEFGASSAVFGPEFGFGQVMDYQFEEPVLLIKSSIGNRSISWDFCPPGTAQFNWNNGVDDWTYAGYGESPNSWLTGTTPVPISWYAGRQWDECFMDESEWAPMATTLGMAPVFNVVDILDNFASEYPDYATQGFEIAGYVWWQGHKDQSFPHADRYEQNMASFITAIRNYYETRYPTNTVANAPFVLATVAFDGGWENTQEPFLAIANGQLAVSDPAKHPEFAGNVKTVEARGYWRDGSVSPTTTGYHYNHNAETYMLVGDALGRAMVELQGAEPPVDTNPPSPNPMTWASLPVALSSSSIAMTATTAVDTNGVEYYFSNVTDGSHDSGWQASSTYIDMGLAPDTHYSYTVKARDMSVSHNETGLSAVAGITTGLDLSMEVPFVESFESYTNGHSLGGSNGWLDENAHVSTDSALISALVAYENAGNEFPINVTHEKVMDVASGGSITKLFNDVGNGTTLYSDFLVMPVYGTDFPTPQESDVQLGVHVGSSGNLFVWHSYFNPDNSQVSNEWHQLNASVTADVWTRITLAQDYVNNLYQLRINGGMAVTDAKGLSMVGGVPGGSWFKMAAHPGNLSEFIVKSGNLDDLVVTPVPPEGAIASAGTRANATWVNTYGGNPALINQDGDGLTLDQEYLIETDPTVSNEFKIVAVGSTTPSNKPYLWYNANGEPNGFLTVSNKTDLVAGAAERLLGNLYFDGTNIVEWVGIEEMKTNGFLRIYVQ